MPARLLWLHLFVLMGLLLTATACRRREQAASYQARIGIAVKLNDRVCMAIHNARLLPGASIILLEPAGIANQRATTSRAFITSGSADNCPGIKGDAEVSNYNLQITTGTVQANLPLIALEARLPSVMAAHSFHSCATADGIHLTAWDGAKPLEGHRLWKQYYYLNEDLGTSCTSAETEP